MTVVWIALGTVGVILLGLAISYNRFIRQRQLITNSWANVDTELRRRYDLIPNLVETVKGYAEHEATVLEGVTAARAAAVQDTGRPARQAGTENVLVRSLRSLLAVAEDYPDLKASDHFLELQRELSMTEDRIQAARRFYNNNVRAYNTRVFAFPSIIIAKLFDFEQHDFFEVEPIVRAGVRVDPTD